MNFDSFDLGSFNRKRRTFLKQILTVGSLFHLSTIISKNLLAQELDSLNRKSAIDPIDSIGYLSKGKKTMNVLLLCVSIHHQNTAKIANVFSRIFATPVRSPADITVDELAHYDLIGFGSGIYSQRHHQSMIDLVEQIPDKVRKSAFIFSTSGISRNFAVKNSVDDPHTVIRQMLLKKNWTIAGEYNCAGWNTNSFLKFFGGMNKGKPDTKDLTEAEKFARGIFA